MLEQKEQALFQAVEDNNFFIVNAMIESGANTKAKNQKGLSLLNLANKLGYAKMVSYLNSKGAA